MHDDNEIILLVFSHIPRAGLPGFADEALNVGANITFPESIKQHFVKQNVSGSRRFVNHTFFLTTHFRTDFLKYLTIFNNN